MHKTWGIVSLLAVVGCASSGGEQRRTTTAATESGDSSSPEAISPERQDAIERLFTRKATELQDCWTREYEKTHNRKIEGDVTVALEIQPSGSAQNVRILKSTLNNADIESCVTAQIGGWSFPEGQSTVPYNRTVHIGAQY
jgi:hypothetical protein